jgi:ABC-type dipeptide/oligopeptide/nickel transport system ATPase component
VKLEHVTFTYPGKTTPALKGVSLDALPGCTVALVGPSGSGKSSVVELLLRNHTAQEGVVRLDEKKMGEWEPRWVRQQVGQAFPLSPHRSRFDGHGSDEEGFGWEMSSRPLDRFATFKALCDGTLLSKHCATGQLSKHCATGRCCARLSRLTCGARCTVGS